MPVKYASKAKIEKICRNRCSLSAANLKRLVRAIMLAQRVAAQRGPEVVNKILRKVSG